MMEEPENKARTTQQLRSDVENGITSWSDAVQRQNQERSAQNGMATYGQMKELVGRQELAELQNSERAQDAIASALAIASAPENKGRLPSVVTDYLNRQFGFDGQTAGIVEGGIDPKTGEFGFVFGERDSAGKTSYRKQTIPLSAQLGIMEGYPSLFGEDAVAAHRQKMLDSGLSSAEVDSYSKVARLAREQLEQRKNDLSASFAPRGNGVEIARINAEARDRAERAKQDRFERSQGAKDDRFAFEVHKAMNKESKDFLNGLSDEDRASAQKDFADFAAMMKKKYGGRQKPTDGEATQGSGGNGGRETKKDKDGIEWEIVRDAKGKPIGKKRVTK